MQGKYQALRFLLQPHQSGRTLKETLRTLGWSLDVESGSRSCGFHAMASLGSSLCKAGPPPLLHHCYGTPGRLPSWLCDPIESFRRPGQLLTDTACPLIAQPESRTIFRRWMRLHSKGAQATFGLPHTAGRPVVVAQAAGFHYHHHRMAIMAPVLADHVLRQLHESGGKHVPGQVAIDEDEHAEEDIFRGKSLGGAYAKVAQLYLRSGSASIPHPAKQARGGEDAHFVDDADNACGVADGVGGWSEVGIDAGQYARELMSQCMAALREEPVGKPDTRRVLARAHARTRSQGSSTACIMVLSAGGRLEAVNLGDSGFVVFREGRIVFKSPTQQHEFNFPFQLGSMGCDDPARAEVFKVNVLPGDVLVVGTDGLFDNVFDHELAGIVVTAVRAGWGPQETAQRVAALARIRAQDKQRQSPFSRAAQDAGYRFVGGKMDDITVIVSFIRDEQTLSQKQAVATVVRSMAR